MPRVWPYAAGALCSGCGDPLQAARKHPLCTPCAAAYAREYRARPEVRARKIEQHREKVYGVSQAEYDALSDAQNGVCAICKRPERATRRGFVKTLSLDHDHETGHPRGLLCQSCNTAIGLLDDSPALLIAAIRYLQDRVTTR